MSVEVQDIFIEHFADYKKSHYVSLPQLKAARHIMDCRTASLGGHTDVCDNCGYTKISYNSCRDRHCPKCQAYAKEVWLEKERKNLLNTNYFHVVFTVPAELNQLFLSNPTTMINILFQASSETVMQLSKDKKYLGATPGLIGILHTWGQQLVYHPHVHYSVTGGGITPIGTWTDSKKKFFLPVRVMSKKFRGKFLALLKSKIPDVDPKLLTSCYSKKWVVYCKPPFGSAEKVLGYIGRYTHRTGIDNHRILSLEDGMVTFSYRDYSDNNKQKELTIDAEEFIRRFLLHILPPGLRKIRHYGVYALRDRGVRLDLCRKLTNTPSPLPPLTGIDLIARMLGKDFNLCPHCRIGHFSHARDQPIEA